MSCDLQISGRQEMAVEFSKADIPTDLVKRSAITYMEGYLFDKDEAKAAFVKAAEIATAAGDCVRCPAGSDYASPRD